MTTFNLRSRFQPEEWSDPKRAQFLMREFRPRDVNPDGYDDKLAFWTRNIHLWSRERRSPSFALKDVREAFTREGFPPDRSCIEHVFTHLIGQGILRNKDELEKELKQRTAFNDSWQSWTFRQVAKPVNWVWSYAMSTSSADIPDKELFVDMDTLKEVSTELTNEVARSERQIFRINELALLESVKELPPAAIDLVLLFLTAEKKVAVEDDVSGKLIKFGDRNPLLTKTEVGLKRLESAKELIESEVTSINRQMEVLKTEARKYLKENNKSGAKQVIKRKKRLETVLEGKQNQLDNIEVLIRKLEDTDAQDVVIKSYQEAAEVLRSLQKNPSQTIEDINEIMSDMQDTIEASKSFDVSRLVIDPCVVEDDLEAELSDILSTEDKSDSREPMTTSTPSDVDELLLRLQKLRSADLPDLEEGGSTSKVKVKKMPVNV